MKKILLIFLLAFCSAAFGQQNLKKLDLLMTAEMIGVQIGYIENIVGPAKRVLDKNRQYDVDGCVVNIMESKTDKSVASIELRDINNKCDFDTARILLDKNATKLNFEDVISNQTRWLPYLSCFNLCGNAVEPSYGAVIESPRARQSMNYSVTVNYNDSSNSAVDKFRHYLKTDFPEIEYWVGGYPDKSISIKVYSERWYEAFKNVKISSIKFGYLLLDGYEQEVNTEIAVIAAKETKKEEEE